MNQLNKGMIIGIVTVIAIVLIFLLSALAIFNAIQKKKADQENSAVNVQNSAKSATTNQASQQNELLNQTPYHNKDYGFSINPPKGWEVKETGKSGTIVYFFDPNEGGENTNINVHMQVDSEDLDSLMLEIRKELQQVFPGYETIENEKVTVNGNLAVLNGGKLKIKSVPIRQLGLVLVKNGKAYTINATAFQSDWNKYENIFKASLMSFTLD